MTSLPDRIASDLRDKLTRYENALRGIASCATDCQCCRMHQHLAQAALDGQRVEPPAWVCACGAATAQRYCEACGQGRGFDKWQPWPDD